MRAGPESRSRPSRSSICALALSALALACGSSPAAGVRIELGGASGGGSSGSGSGGATGGGGTGVGAGGSSATDAGVADALPPFDGGGCTDDTQAESIGTAATGTFSGDGVNGAVCTRGAFAYIQSTPADDGGAPRVELLVETTVKGSPAAALRFSAPGNVLAGDISADIGLPGPTPGTYTAATTCGSAVLVAMLPAPDPSVCATDAGEGGGCPTGCELTGPIFAQVCTPLPPELDFVALASDDCRGDSTQPAGAWTLTLASVTPYPADAGTYGVVGAAYYEVHGTLTATLADPQSDGGAAGVSLSLSF